MAAEPRQVHINTQTIPVGRSIGAAVLVGIVLLGLLLDLPGVRGRPSGAVASD